MEYYRYTNELSHHGIKGQKWGIRRFQNKDGTLTNEGKHRYSKKVIFVSGSSKTTTKDSEYYRKKLPQSVREKLDIFMKQKVKFVVGDAPGIDRQVQDYLNSNKYAYVTIYGPDEIRYIANKKWKSKAIKAPEFEKGSKDWLAKKDVAMSKVASEGICIILDEGSKATRENIKRLLNDKKNVSIYELSKDGPDKDHWKNN